MSRKKCKKNTQFEEEKRVIPTLLCRISDVVINNQGPKKSFIIVTPLKKTGVEVRGSITCTYANVSTGRTRIKRLKKGNSLKVFRVHFIPGKGWRAGGAIVLNERKKKT